MEWSVPAADGSRNFRPELVDAQTDTFADGIGQKWENYRKSMPAGCGAEWIDQPAIARASSVEPALAGLLISIGFDRANLNSASSFSRLVADWAKFTRRHLRAIDETQK